MLRSLSGPIHNSIGRAMTPVVLCLFLYYVIRMAINLMSLTSDFLPFMFLTTWSSIGTNIGLKTYLNNNPTFATK